MIRFFSFILIFFSSCVNTDVSKVIVKEIPSNQLDFQKKIIAQLSGHKAIQRINEIDVSITGRWNSMEKSITIGYLDQIIQSMGLEMQFHSYSFPNSNIAIDLLLEPLQGNNIYTTLPSTTGSNDYVLLGAHYDTRGEDIPGAIDNGSGIALVLSVLRKAKALEMRDKNLMVVFFDQEEESISAGSISFAKYLNTTDLNIHSVHTYDMIGWDGDNNKEVEIELPSPEIEQMYQRHAALLNIPIYTSNANSSDHYSFIKAGINAVGVSQAISKGDNSGFKDTVKDKFHLVNFEYLESCTQLAFEVIKEIINE